MIFGSIERDLVEANFIGDRDDENIPLPLDPRNPPADTEEEIKVHLRENDYMNCHLIPLENAYGDPEKEWTNYNLPLAGAFLGKGCQGAMLLSEFSKELQHNVSCLASI